MVKRLWLVNLLGYSISSRERRSLAEMEKIKNLLIVLLALTGSSAIVVKNLEELAVAKQIAQTITLMDMNIPANVTLDLTNLKRGTIVEFGGTIRFGYSTWSGPLIFVSGKELEIRGLPGHVIDCEGQRWWDRRGGNGGKLKPWFFRTHLTNSIIKNLNVKNTPVHGFSVIGKNLTIAGVRIDNHIGHVNGRNTDGFDVSHSNNVTIRDCIVDNQDDCLAVNSGSDIYFLNNICRGGHGISIAPMRNGTVVANITMANCVVEDSMAGLRIKTTKYETGVVDGITFENITMKNIAQTGIAIHGNYMDGQPNVGEPTPGYPITNLRVVNVTGTVRGKRATGVWVWLKEASNWTWDANITGGRRKMSCKGIPSGVKMTCGI